MSCGIGKEYSTFYKRILQNLIWTPKAQAYMTDKTRAGHNTRSMNPKYDKPLRIICDVGELHLADTSEFQ